MKKIFLSGLSLIIIFLLITFSIPVTIAHAADNSTIYFPLQTMSDDSWETEICVINTSDTDNLNGSFNAYGQTGNLVSSIDDVMITPNGRRQILVGFDLADADDICYIVFEGDRETVSGYMKFYVYGHYRTAIPGVLGSEINSGDFFIPHIASVNNWRTYISLVNTNSEPVLLSIEFNNGTIVTFPMDSKAYRFFSIAELFDGVLQPDIGSAVIKNAPGVIGMELFIDSNSSILSGVLLNDDTTDQIYFPHIAAKNGWGTGIVAFNPTDTAANLTITSYDDKGTVLNTSSDISIDPKERYIGLISRLGLPTDAEWIDIHSTQQITGFELFTTTHQMGGYTGVNISRRNGIFPKLEKDGATGVAFVNLENEQASVTLTAYNDTGNTIATLTLNLGPKSKKVELAKNFFDQDISSATYLKYTSSHDIVGFQLNVSNDGWMLDGLPALGEKATAGLEQEVRENLDLIFALMSEESWTFDEVTAILNEEGPQPVVTPEEIDLANLPETITVEIDYGAGFTASDGSIISGNILLTLNNPAFSATGISSDFILALNDLERNGETIATGSVTGSISLTPESSGETLQFIGTVQFNNLQLEDETINGNVNISGTGINLNMSDPGATAFELITLTFDNLDVGDETITDGTIKVTNPAANQMQLDTDPKLSTSFGDVDMLILIEQVDTNTIAFSTVKSGTIGDFTVTMNNVTMNSEICESYPISGSIDFVRGSESGTVTFTDACDGSYQYTNN
jgi:hypothetical protein